MSAAAPGPESSTPDLARQKALREVYVYRDMVEGFMMDDLNVERVCTAIAALERARETMLAHGIDVVPRRW
jgi:hypothetical protein